MASEPHRNRLRTARRKLGLTQAEVAIVLGVASADSISRLERGIGMPTLQQSIALMVLFKRSFGELWPDLNYEYEAKADWNIRLIMADLEKQVIGSGRKHTRAKTLYHKLSTIVNGLPEDMTTIK
jgi:transcriptional regulator with XRE-family HTH domain